jgi:hypothetical protein
MRRMFSPNLGDYKPTVTRINYSIANFKNKVYLYGGMDENNKVI